MPSKCVSCLKPLFRILPLMLACWLFGTLSVQAQTSCPSPCTLVVGQTFTLTSTHDGSNTTGYRVYVDGVKVGSDLSLTSLSSGGVTVPALVAPARGAHTLQLAAFNLDKETKSDPLAFTTQSPAPSKPGPIQITLAIVVAEDGTVTFKIVPAEPVPGGGL